jgi:hypothetical protein
MVGSQNWSAEIFGRIAASKAPARSSDYDNDNDNGNGNGND